MDEVELHKDLICDYFGSLDSASLVITHSGDLNLPELDGETVKYVLNPEQDDYFPLVDQSEPPNRTVMAGDYNFSVEIDSTHVHKKKYLYSHRLNKIYVDMKTDFPVQFNWDHTKSPSSVYVRATLVFADESQAGKPVERCVQHLHEPVSSAEEKERVRHVLQSSRGASAGVRHAGGPEGWRSVVVRLQSPASHAYTFKCKNSCSSGINRRAIEIIFTLEDCHGHVLGRQRVGARVCACPRRDILKDEEAEGVPRKKRPAAPAASAPAAPDAGKKVKLEPIDDSTLTLPPLPVADVKSLTAGLEVMVRMMEQGLEQRHDSQAEKYNKCINDMKQYLTNLNGE